MKFKGFWYDGLLINEVRNCVSELALDCADIADVAVIRILK